MDAEANICETHLTSFLTSSRKPIPKLNNHQQEWTMTTRKQKKTNEREREVKFHYEDCIGMFTLLSFAFVGRGMKGVGLIWINGTRTIPMVYMPHLFRGVQLGWEVHGCYPKQYPSRSQYGPHDDGFTSQTPSESCFPVVVIVLPNVTWDVWLVSNPSFKQLDEH